MSHPPEESAAFIALVQASAGAMGGVFASFVLMPVEVAKTRIQLSRGGEGASTSTLAIVQEVAAEEGLPGLFRGSVAKCSETGAKGFVYFYIYDAINAVAKRRTKLNMPMKLLLGYIAGVGTIVSTMPLEVLATRAQTEGGGGGLLSVAARLLREEGVQALFTGFWYNILLCINPAIQNTCFDTLKAKLLAAARKRGGSASLTPLQAFFLGALAKAVATSITYPLVRLKTILQAGKESQLSAPRKSLSRKSSTNELVQQISTRLDRPVEQQELSDRVIEMYRGLGSALTKSVLQAALLYMTKDQVAGTVKWLFGLTARVFFRKHGVPKLGAMSGRPLPS